MMTTPGAVSAIFSHALSAKRGRSVTGAAASQLAGARAVRPPSQQRREHGAEQLAALAEGGLHLVRVRARVRVRALGLER